MHFQELATKRYSCRSFSDQPVEQDKLRAILQAARKAPTAVNRQPYRIFVMDSPEAKSALKQATSYTFGADSFLLVGYREDEAWVRPFDQKPFGPVDASIIATHLMLAVYDLGLATTWVGYFNAPLLQELCPQTRGFELIALFPIGYPAEDGVPSKRHFERKAEDEVIQRL